MPRGIPGSRKRSPNSTSEHIQFRWNWQDEHGRAALEALKKSRKDNPGKTDAEIFADAICKYGGVKVPEKATNVQIFRKLERLEETLEASRAEMNDIIARALRGIDLDQYIHQESHQTLAEELGESIPAHVLDEMLKGVSSQMFEVD